MSRRADGPPADPAERQKEADVRKGQADGGSNDNDNSRVGIYSVRGSMTVQQFMNTAATSAAGPVMALYATSLGASIGFATLVVAASGFVSASTVLFWGVMADRVGRGPLLYLSAVASVIGAASTYAAYDLNTLLLTRVLAGFGASILLPVSYSLTLDFSARGSYGRSMGNIGTALQLGGFLGPLMGGLIGTDFGYRNVFVYTALLCTPNVLLAHITAGRIKKANLTRASARDPSSSRTPVMKRNFSGGLFGNMFAVCSTSTFGSILPLYVVNYLHVTDSAGVGVIIATGAIGQVFGRYFLASISDTRGRRLPIVVGLAIAGCSLLALLVVRDFWSLVAVTTSTGLGCSLVLPAAAALVNDSVPVARRGTGMGAYATFGMGGGSFGGTTLGFVAQDLGFAYAFGGMAVADLLASVALAYLIVRIRDEKG